MKLQLKNPIQIEDKIYPYVMLSMSISSNQVDVEKYFFATNLVPYRIDGDGKIEKLEDRSIPISVLNILDSQFKTLGEDILNSIQSQLNNM